MKNFTLNIDGKERQITESELKWLRLIGKLKNIWNRIPSWTKELNGFMHSKKNEPTCLALILSIKIHISIS